MNSTPVKAATYENTPLLMRALSAIATTLAAFVATVLIAIAAFFLMGYRPYVVISASMEPELSVGSLCVIDTTAAFNEVAAGDVVGFTTESGETVTHRVTEVTDEGFITKGDANSVADGLTTTNQNYVGNVVWSVPVVGTLIMAAKTPVGIISVAALMFMVLFASSLIDRSLTSSQDQAWKSDVPSTSLTA